MNSVNLIGNIGNDIDLKYTGSGNAVTNINVAVNEYSNGEQVTQWFRVTVWGEKAENLAKYCGKGSKVGISGRLRNNTFTDKQGNERMNTEITAFQVDFLDSKNNGNRTQEQNVNNQYQTNNSFAENSTVEVLDDDLPF